MADIELVIELDASKVEAGARDVQQSMENIKQTVNSLVAVSKSSMKQLAEGMTFTFARWMTEAKNYGSQFLESFQRGLQYLPAPAPAPLAQRLLREWSSGWCSAR